MFLSSLNCAVYVIVSLSAESFASSALIVASTVGSQPVKTQSASACGLLPFAASTSPAYAGVAVPTVSSVNSVASATSSVNVPCSPFAYFTVKRSSSSGMSLLFLSSFHSPVNATSFSGIVNLPSVTVTSLVVQPTNT